MTCYTPIKAYYLPYKTPSGKQAVTFNHQKSNGNPLQLPCGQCIGCRLDRSLQWAIRCMHEAQMHEENSFITLTYSPENLPQDNSLNPQHFQKFMKRLRKKYSQKKIRFYHCGEYGEELNRPHYHALLFGHDFADKEFFKEERGSRLYISPELQKLWPYGFSTIGAVTFQSAAYCARYIMKKQNGDSAESHYQKVSENTGEIFNLKPEYTTMSRGDNKPDGTFGLGYSWYQKYKTDLWPCDFVVMNGKKYKVPRYYTDLLEKEDPDTHMQIKKQRKEKAKQHKDNQTEERLDVRRICQESRTKKLKRNIH